MTIQSSFATKRPRRSRGAKSAPRERPGPEGGTRDKNRRERIAALEKAGLRLFLAHGVEGVTVDALAAAADMAKGNFYRYFSDVESLVVHLLTPVQSGMRAAFDDCEARLRAARSRDELVSAYESLAGSLAMTMLGAVDVARLYLQESRGPATGARRPIARVAREVRASALALTEAAHAHGLLRPMPAAVSAHAVVGAVEELVFVGLSGHDLGNPAMVAANLVELVLDGLRAR